MTTKKCKMILMKNKKVAIKRCKTVADNMFFILL